MNGSADNAALVAAIQDQTRAIDELVRSNSLILDELITERRLQPDNEAQPATYLNGSPRA